MIIAVVISIFPAQGAIAQQDEVMSSDSEPKNTYTYEQEEFTEIINKDLPKSIQSAAKNDFNNLHIYKAYMSKDNTYRVILKNQDNFTKVVFANANGKWIMPINDKS